MTQALLPLCRFWTMEHPFTVFTDSELRHYPLLHLNGFQIMTHPFTVIVWIPNNCKPLNFLWILKMTMLLSPLHEFQPWCSPFLPLYGFDITLYYRYIDFNSLLILNHGLISNYCYMNSKLRHILYKRYMDSKLWHYR